MSSDALEKLPRAVLQSLKLTPPVPHEATEWCAGWVDAPPSCVKEMRGLRTQALGALLGHRDMGHACTLDTANKLWVYADKLAQFSKRACTNRRRWPLNFTWCFPGEVMSVGHDPSERNYRRTAVMRSCYPAFEALCAGVASTVLTLRAIVDGRRANRDDLAPVETMFVQHTRAILAWLPDIAATTQGDDRLIFSESQWAGLCRQEIPIQLHRWWHEYSIAAFHHCSQLQAAIAASDDPTECAACVRGAVTTAQVSIERIRLGLHRCPTLNSTQVDIVQKIYDIMVSEYKRMEGQALVHDVTHSLRACVANSGPLLVMLRHCWCALAKIGQPVSQEMETWYAKAFRVSGTAHASGRSPTQPQIDKWRAGLCTHVVELPQ